MSPGQERAVFKLFYLLAQVVGHEHITESRTETIQFCRIAEAMDSRYDRMHGRRRREKAEARLCHVTTYVTQYIESALDTLKTESGEKRIKSIEYDLRNALKVLR